MINFKLAMSFFVLSAVFCFAQFPPPLCPPYCPAKPCSPSGCPPVVSPTVQLDKLFPHQDIASIVWGSARPATFEIAQQSTPVTNNPHTCPANPQGGQLCTTNTSSCDSQGNCSVTLGASGSGNFNYVLDGPDNSTVVVLYSYLVMALNT